MKNNSGVALIVVLWILVILEVVIGGLVYIARLQARISNYRYRECQARAISRSGIERVIGTIYEIQGQKNIDESFPEIYPRSLSGEIGDGQYAIRLVNEESKINLNTASKAVLEKVFVASDLTNSAIVLDLVCQYHANGWKLKTIRELLLHENISEEMVAKIGAIATVNSNGKININTVSAELLKDLPGMTAKEAEKIINYRIGLDHLSGTIDDQYIDEKILSQLIDGAIINQNKELFCYQAETFQAVCTACYDRIYRKITAYLYYDAINRAVKIIYWQED
ncbi:MAG: helix-hairpin-helix domain-containing protein [bacterium]|jgi:type II secretory pathway component PulK|nr:helix-hairpin-helix domain-containing protein [bacterium]